MSYRLERAESVSHGIRRIAIEQIEKAIGEIDDDTLSRHDAVHQVRKRFKKIRGLVRLVRPALGDQYEPINIWYRDAGRRLSEIRDATTMIECFDELAESASDVIEDAVLQSIHNRLVDRRQRIESASRPVEKTLDEIACALSEQRQQVDTWSLDDDGFDAIAGGLGKSFRRGRKTLNRAEQSPTDENLHEWRKRVKYHWFHSRLLRNVWPEVLKARINEMDRLSDLLGDDHDLAVLHETMKTSPPDDIGDAGVIPPLEGLIQQRRSDLQRQAFDVGRRVYADSAKRLTQHLGVWWDVWISDDARDI
ncbi:CHAD domain protein [Maioricimonas rarisocia]|uniref:CHAD domain protein n=1 Tax=Maioricimonas rarisocia TaxID=2528026 RepID=A0A517Z6S2_9PLAN|nr:CHAD domain-containing protein [Maioricimonas rarisocia]QDU38188.1 CHAD domain protein [Maioricimonas rarisocia]